MGREEPGGERERERGSKFIIPELAHAAQDIEINNGRTFQFGFRHFQVGRIVSRYPRVATRNCVRQFDSRECCACG